MVSIRLTMNIRNLQPVRIISVSRQFTEYVWTRTTELTITVFDVGQTVFMVNEGKGLRR